MFSRAGTTALLTILAKPVRFSLRTGFFLCGIADDPICFFLKNSYTSATSVLCRLRISTANLSIELAIIPKTEKKYACLSLGMICVEIGSILKPNFFATYFSTFGSMLANVPTAPEIAQVDISSMAC